MTDPGQVSSHSPLKFGSIDVTVVRRPHWNGSPAASYRHAEAERSAGWQCPVNARLGCQASLRRLGLDDFLFDHYQAFTERSIRAEDAYEWLAYAL